MAKSLKPEAGDEAKLSKKQLKKLKKNNGEAAAKAAEEAKDTAKSDKKVQFAKNLEQGPTGSTKATETAAASSKSSGPKTVQGVKIDDKKVGKGPACKKGDKIGMRYIGKLTDGKVFDCMLTNAPDLYLITNSTIANKSGKPFSFKLGTGEVIQGWDIGVAGMSVGGERRITIPAHLAYGKKALPGIPANSTLVFDVKLLEIH